MPSPWQSCALTAAFRTFKTNYVAKRKVTSAKEPSFHCKGTLSTVFFNASITSAGTHPAKWFSEMEAKALAMRVCQG